MHVDLFTLYLIIIGTLLASACLTYWEHRTHPGRSTSLRLLAAGFATLAAGCSIALYRAALPGVLGSALSNLVILGGYLLVLNAVAALNGRLYRAGSLGLLGVMALIWAGAGYSGQNLVWTYVSAFPIALVSGLTAWELLRCQALRPLLPLRIAVAVTGLHALLYLGRSFILPWWVARDGPAAQMLASNITMYEGVLYSIVLPMTLLKLVREETHGQLLRESQTDYLTRLGNRRWFFEQGQRLIDGGRGREPLAVLAFDLDQFKSINDRYGHQTGDLVLKSFADIARGVLGPAVLLARIGGENSPPCWPATTPAAPSRWARTWPGVSPRRCPAASTAWASRPPSASGWRSTSTTRRPWPRAVDRRPGAVPRQGAGRQPAGSGATGRAHGGRLRRPAARCMTAHQAGASGDRRRPLAARMDARPLAILPRPEHGTVLHHVPSSLADAQPGRLLVRTPQ